MKTYVLMFLEKCGDFVSIHHVAVIPCNDRRAVIRYAKECLLAGHCYGRYVGNRCVVYCTDDHSMVELVCKDGSVEVFN